MRAFALAAMIAALSSTTWAQETPVPAPSDWGQVLAEDARAFHDLIADSHPGPVDELNPGFNMLLDNGLALALARAETADSYPDWYFALQEFQASFNDGHLSLANHAPMGHVWRMAWPGFLTGLRGDGEAERHEVVFNQDPAAPPVGAVLVSCDGRPAAALAEDIVGRAVGRWNLRSRRARFASTLFVDQGNPYVQMPSNCLFEVDGSTRAYSLEWRDLPDAVRDEGFAAANSPRYFAPIELRTWVAGVWIGLGSFDGDLASEAGQQLANLLTEIEARRDEIRAAPVVVFDLRGNGGGSSLWSSRIARLLWGEDRVAALSPRSEGVDWRASQGNLETIEMYRDELFASQPEARAWAAAIAAGLAESRDAGRPLWRQAGDTSERPALEGPSPMAGRAFVVTDYGCASACLDAVDIFRAMGAVTVGQETSGDTVYMEIRQQVLPSGRVTARIPMKVYRGRARGDNETVRPAHAWTGDLSDTAGLENFIVGLD